MPRWRISYDSKTAVHRHRVAPGFGHALLVPIVSEAFKMLRVSATIAHGKFWFAIHGTPSLLPFELAHGAELERDRYNLRCFAEVRRTKRLVRGQHRGHTDLFVPIVS
ncbi:MAG TPA: hypothetical protein VGP93_12360, partial [Polyangiaceae bacterium]|nr:hypothetical protein [Polyangiaceae bacterium]